MACPATRSSTPSNKALQFMMDHAALVTLVQCQASRRVGKYIMAKLHSMAGTGYIYHKRRLRIAPKLEMVKYDPLVRAHVLFKESKVVIPENFGAKINVNQS